MRLAFIPLLLLANPLTASAACGIADLGTGEVAAVRDDATLLLKDGRSVRLAGIEPSPAAQPLLARLATGRTVRLSAATQPEMDRYGRILAFARADHGALQETLLTQGAARVAVRAGGRACADGLLRLENEARQNHQGLWADPNFRPLAAESGTWTQERLGTFVLIEGTVVSVRQSGGMVYVNFGRRWTRAFTLTVPRRLQAAFRAAGRDPQMLQGRRVRVRGWLERRTGPIIETSAPEQIECWSRMSMRQGGRCRMLGSGLALLLALAGCTGIPDFKQVSLPLPSEAALDAQHAKAAGRESARILGSYGGVYENPKLQAIIEKTVARLVAASERPELKYEVTVLNSPAINAYALPNGRIYVTRGLMALANNEAELASVLSHEMGHVIARHGAIREEQARQAAVVAHVVTDVLDDPAAGALALAKSKLTLANFSRAQELEADAIGVGMSARAGYDPYGAARMLTQMQRSAELKAGKYGSDPRALDFLSSHPATPERIKNAVANAKQYASAGERDRNTYLDALDGAVYGEDPSEGLVRGRRFIHGRLGFTFTAPPNFVLDNTAQAVLGLKGDGDEALRLDVVSVPPEQTLGTYLSSGWIENVDRASVEETTINGFPAATATATGDSWSFGLYVIRYGSDVYRFIFATKQRSIESDRAFREAVQSFRRMSLEEAAKVQPLHVALATVRPGDTVEKLARRMAVPEHALETFRTINGLAQGETLAPGRKVKLIVE